MGNVVYHQDKLHNNDNNDNNALIIMQPDGFNKSINHQLFLYLQLSYY